MKRYSFHSLLPVEEISLRFQVRDDGEKQIEKEKNYEISKQKIVRSIESNVWNDPSTLHVCIKKKKLKKKLTSENQQKEYTDNWQH